MDEQGDQQDLTHRWVQEHADRQHGGDWVQAAICLLSAARQRELNPDKLWGGAGAPPALPPAGLAGQPVATRLDL